MNLVKQFLRTRYWQGFLYLSVGAFSAVVYFSLFTLFWKLFFVDETIAVTIGYLMSVLAHFLGNRYLTFKHAGGRIMDQMPRYLVMVCVNYLITLAVAYCVVDRLQYSPYLAIAFSIIATMASGYFMARNWVFSI